MGFWLSLVLMLVTAVIALLGAYPLILYSAANLLVLLPSSRKYPSGRAKAPPNPHTKRGSRRRRTPSS